MPRTRNQSQGQGQAGRVGVEATGCGCCVSEAVTPVPGTGLAAEKGKDLGDANAAT